MTLGFGLLLKAFEEHWILEERQDRCRAAIEENLDVRETIQQFKADKRQISRLIEFLVEPETAGPPLRDIFQFAPLLKPNWSITSAKLADGEILLEGRRAQSALWLGLRRDKPTEFVDAIEQHLEQTLDVETSLTANMEANRFQILIRIEERVGEEVSR